MSIPDSSEETAAHSIWKPFSKYYLAKRFLGTERHKVNNKLGVRLIVGWKWRSGFCFMDLDFER